MNCPVCGAKLIHYDKSVPSAYVHELGTCVGYLLKKVANGG